MTLLDVLVPQMGEGLQEVVIIGFHKKPGDAVKRDELLYSMETDKAVMDVESPYEGILTEWLTKEGAVLPIGTPVASIQTEGVGERVSGGRGEDEKVGRGDGETPERESGGGGERESPRTSPRVGTDVVIPPRTRALCKELGISDEEMRAIPTSGGKLMPADVEAYAAMRPVQSSAPSSEATSAETALPPNAPPLTQELHIDPDSPQGGDSAPPEVAAPSALPGYQYAEQPLTPRQRAFTSRMRRSGALVIPATMTRPVMWEPLGACTTSHREQDFTFRPTDFQTLAWCIARATRNHPKFRSTLVGDDTVREFDHLNLGVAVGLKGGELVTAVVKDADTLDYRDFVMQLQAAISVAREGKDQADAATQLHLTYLGAYGITEGTPVLVAPAIAVMFVGAGYPRDGKIWANLTLTIDHRLINGVEGAQFLQTVVETIGKLDEIT